MTTVITPNPVYVTQQYYNPTIMVTNPAITVTQETLQVNVTVPVVGTSFGFTPFKFIATQGQSSFVLNTLPNFIVYLSINGTVQSQLAGDFTVTGLNIVLNGTLNNGDIVAGVYV